MVWKDIPKDESSKLSSALEAVRLPIYIRLSGFGVAVGVVPVRVSDGSSKRVPELPESFSRGGFADLGNQVYFLGERGLSSRFWESGSESVPGPSPWHEVLRTSVPLAQIGFRTVPQVL